MGPNRTNGGLLAASLIAWLLMLPPLSITSGGKTVVDGNAPLYHWENFSTHPTTKACRDHRDQLRVELQQAGGPTPAPPKKGEKAADTNQIAFGLLRQRATAARCISSTDSRLKAPPTGSDSGTR
jgi:hypothetical protein